MRETSGLLRRLMPEVELMSDDKNNNDSGKKSLRPAVHSDIEFTVEEIPEATVYDAGFLTVTNASWRTSVPVCDRSRCNGCLNCYLYCPEGCIFRKNDGKKTEVEIDYDFCKGCGICARVCRKGAITMEKHGK